MGMNCTVVRPWIFQSIDGELSAQDQEQLNAHLLRCAGCAREMQVLLLPQRLARALPACKPSPFFYQKLRARLNAESQTVSIWQIVPALSRQLVPMLATVTLALISVFAYLELRPPEADIYQAYDMIFMSGDHPQRMVIAEQGEITEESVLHAIAEDQQAKVPGSESGDPDRE